MIVKFKSIKNWKNHVYYLFNEDKHQNQQIIGISFFDNFNKNQQIIEVDSMTHYLIIKKYKVVRLYIMLMK